MEIIKGLEQLIYEERLIGLGLFNLEKRTLSKVLINVCKYLQGGHKEDGSRLFSVMPSDSTRSNTFFL